MMRYDETSVPAPMLSTAHHAHRFPTALNPKRGKTMRTLARAAIIGGTIVALGAASLGGIAVATADDTEAPRPALTAELDGTTVNGLATEQEAEAAAAEAARLEAEAAAAAAAAAEAERIAAEQAAAAAAAEQAASAPEAADQGDAPAPAPAPEPFVPEGAVYDPETDSMAHTICEVLPDGTPVPCQ